MTLDELNLIKEVLEGTLFMLHEHEVDDYNKTLKCKWIIQREIELKTKCTETKYTNCSGE